MFFGRNALGGSDALNTHGGSKLGRALVVGLLAVFAGLTTLSPSTALAANKVYTDNGNGTVTDPTTGLTWMRCAMGQVWDGRTCTGTATSFNLTTLAALTGTTTFAGQSDWRVPNIRELRSIADPTRFNPAIDTEAFPNTPFNSSYLSSTNNASATFVNWVVNFQDGSVGSGNQTGNTRLVRGGQSTGLMDVLRPTTDYVANTDGTATHRPTNLTWQRCAVGRTWTGSACTGTATSLTLAQASALTSNFAGKTDWRLPTAAELESLVIYNNLTNVLNSTIFRSSTGADTFWSSSQYLPSTANSWYLRTSDGVQSFTSPTNPLQVILVRSETSTPPVILALTGIALSTNRLVIGSTSTVAISPIPVGATLPTCIANSASGLVSSVVQINGARVSLTAAASALSAAEAITIQCGPVSTTLTVTPNTNTIAIQMLVGPAALQSGGRTTLTATAVSSFADGTTRAVSPAWASSNPSAANVSASGVLSAGTVTADTPVTLTASFTDNGVTTSATLQVTITAAPATLSVLQLTGASTVQSGGQMRLIANAKYSDGSSKTVFSTSFALSNPALGSVNNRGVLSVVAVTVNTPLTVTATYIEGGVTKTASLPITITAAPAVLSRLTLIGASALLASGQSLNLSALGVYADTSSKPVVATWQVAGTAGTVSSTGVFKAMPVSTDTPVIVTASYTEAAVTVTAQFQVIIQATEAPTPIQAEVQATGTRTNFSLAVWISATAFAPSAAAPSASVKGAGSAPAAAIGRPVYKLYVVTLVPGGIVVPLDTIFTLNRNNEWQGLSFPIAEYMSGVTDNSVQLVEILDKLDVSIISGSKIYMGYGTDDQEMIASGRFRLVYQIQ